jgi:hypothetical protein
VTCGPGAHSRGVGGATEPVCRRLSRTGGSVSVGLAGDNDAGALPPVSASAEGELSPLAEPGLQPAANIALVATSGDGTPEWRLRRIRAEPPDPRRDRRHQAWSRCTASIRAG